MSAQAVTKVVVVGGGTAGWMVAAALSKHLTQAGVSIRLIESADIGTVGVGEATVPGIRLFNGRLGIDEADFVRSTQATFKLGIEFKDWYQQGSSFFHPFAAYGAKIDGQDFYQCWLRLHKEGYDAPLEEFCLSTQMARQHRFAQPDEESDFELSWYNYAYHFDASLYATFLRRYAQARGVTRIEGKITQVNQHSETGFIESVVVDKAGVIEGELFIDCSGFRGLLIEETLKTGYERWDEWLPCDSAVAMQTSSTDIPVPYTTSTAREAGWQWKIPLQHRVGNGYVYCSRFISDDEAVATLKANVAGQALTDPKIIKFTTGVRQQFWNKNCVALGLASGFLEPLESTSISLIQTGIDKLIQYFPDLSFNPENIAQANRMNRMEYERVRDFIILHYKATARRDTDFWRQVSAMSVPEPLQRRMDAFKVDGTLISYEQESFHEPSWLSMYNGFHIVPDTCQAGVAAMNPIALRRMLDEMRQAINIGVSYAPSHQEFLSSLDEAAA